MSNSVQPHRRQPTGLPLGFSRQEHWSGLPFPSPMHESEKWKWSCSVMSDSATPWTAAYQAPLSMGFSRQEYWSGLPLPSPSQIYCHHITGMIISSINQVQATMLLKVSLRNEAPREPLENLPPSVCLIWKSLFFLFYFLFYFSWMPSFSIARDI